MRYLMFFVLLLTFNKGSAVVLEISRDYGLPDKCINALCKDKRGLMWIGTQSGLCMFDGYEFRSLLSETVINREQIRNLIYDEKKKCLWIATEGGLFKLDVFSFEVKKIFLEKSWGNNGVTDMKMFSNELIYVSYKSGQIIEIDKSGAAKLLLSIPYDGKSGVYPSNLLEEGPYMVISMMSVPMYFKYHLGNHSLIKWDSKTKDVPGIEFEGERILFRTDNGTKVFNVPRGISATDSFIKQLQSIDNIASIKYYDSDIAYIACRPCVIYKVDFSKRTVDKIASEFFVGRLVKCLFIDTEGLVWMGTNKGLLKIITHKNSFQKQLFAKPNISVRSFGMDENGDKYAGTYSGLYRFQENIHDWVKWHPVIPFAITNAPGKYLYFVEEQLRLHRIDKETGIVETGFYKEQQDTIVKFTRGNSLAVLNHFEILIGTNSGVAIYNAQTGILKPYKIAGLADNIDVRFLKVIHDNTLLLGTTNGFYQVDMLHLKMVHLSKASQPSLSSNTINSAAVDDQGNIWIATEGGGINVWSADRKNIELLDTKKGLSDNTVYNFIFEDGLAWISTYNGLSCYRFETKTFHNFYSPSDGLSDNEFNRNAFLSDSQNHRLYFGSINGITSFAAAGVDFSRQKNRLFISSLIKWDNDLKGYRNLGIVESPAKNVIVLQPADYSLTINLALSDFSNPERVMFSYRIKGLLDDWVPVNGAHSITLNGLGAGSYTIEVKALDADGAPVTNQLHFYVNVLKPFYKTILFYILILIGVSVLISYVFFLRLRNMKQLSNLREQIAKDLHDDIGSLLTRITMNSDSLKYSKHNDEEKISKLTKISSLSRFAASSMNDILWSIDSRNNFTANLADRIREHAEEVIRPYGVDIATDIQVTDKDAMAAALRHSLYIVFKESMVELIRHCEPTEVSLRLVFKHRHFEIRIQSNGLLSTRKNAADGSGFMNIKKKAKAIEAEASVTFDQELFILEIVRSRRAFKG